MSTIVYTPLITRFTCNIYRLFYRLIMTLLYFPAFSPTNFLENSGLTVSDNIEDIILSQVLEKMGVTDYLQTTQCDLEDYMDTVDGWTNGQIMSYCLYFCNSC